MKKIIILFILFVATQTFAQINGISYQAIILNPKGEQLPGVNNLNSPLVNKDICMVFKFVDEFSNVEYQETVQTKTDGFGMVNLVIGSGNKTAGYAPSFKDIVWNISKKSLIVGINTDGSCTTYIEISNQDFSYVPLALSAISAENVTGVVAIENGGTNAITLAGARTNLQINNVDNISDANKPISIATQSALNLKENLVNKSTDVVADQNSDVKYPSVKAVKIYIDANTSNNVTALANEITRAITAETTIIANLTNETTARSLADGILTTNLSSETSNRTAANLLKEDLANKSTNVTTDGSSDTKYPSVKSVKTYVDASSSTNATALANEVTRATTAENTLTTNLAAEAVTARASELTNATAIATETTNRTTADVTLTTNLAAEVTNRTNADLLKEDLANKSTNVTTDGSSDTKYPSVKSVKTYVDASSSTNATALANEVTRSTTAENTLTTNLAAEAVTARASELTNATAIATETTNRTTADGTLTANLAAEVTNRTNADLLKEDLANKSINVITDGSSDTKYPSVKSVKTYVDASSSTNATALANEVTRATTAENTLTTNLAAEAVTARASELTNATAIATETTNRTTADGTLTANLAVEVTNRTNADLLKEDLANKSINVITDGTSDTKYPSVKSVKTYVDASSSTNATALANEVTRATAAENTLTINLAAETSTRTSDDATLQTNINAVQANVDTNETNRIDADDNIQNSIDSLRDNIDASVTAVTTALALKASIDSPTFTGTVTGIDRTMVGLSNVNDTSDVDKPVSTATQSALDLKANLASPTFTGIPVAPTAAASTNTTQIATTEFVKNQFLNTAETVTNSLQGAIWTSPTTGTLNGVAFTLSSFSGSWTPSIGNSNNSTLDYSSNPLSATQQSCYLAAGSSWTVTFASLVSNLKLYVYWRGPGIGGSVSNSFNQSFSIATESTGLTKSGNNLIISGWGKGILEFVGPITTITFSADGSANSGQGFTFGVLNANIPTSGTGIVARLDSPTFTGTVSGITKPMVGLGNVDNTSDLNKPVSTATQTALDLKVDKVSGKGLSTEDYTTIEKIKLAAIIGTNTGDQDISGIVVNATKIGDLTNLTTTAQSNLVVAVNEIGAEIATNITNIGSLSGLTTTAKSNLVAAVNEIQVEKANLASPTFTGISEAPTADAGTNTTQIATTQFVTTAVAAASENVVDLTTAQTINGIKSFNSDIVVNGITIGKGIGLDNTIIGNEGLFSNTTGDSNTAIGKSALHFNTTGRQNTANGLEALYNNTTGTNNTALGQGVLYSNTTGSQNTSNGGVALYSNTTGSKNTSNGYIALFSNTTGDSNTAHGFRALNENTTGSNNTAIGAEANVSSGELNNATAIGYAAVVSTSNTIQLGNTAVTDVKTSGSITAGAIKIPNTDGTQGQVLSTNGEGILSWTTPTSASSDDFVDLTTNQTIAGNKTFNSNLTVNGITVGLGNGNIVTNTVTGVSALNTNTSGAYNTAFGYSTLSNNETGYANTAIGSGAIDKIIEGNNNTAVGMNAGQKDRSSTYVSNLNNSVFIGAETKSYGHPGYPNVETNQIVIGYNAVGNGSNTIQLGNNQITSVSTSGNIFANSFVRRDGLNGYLMSDGTVSIEIADEFTATASQTSFTLTQTPTVYSKVKMYINGIRISNTAYTINETSLTYYPENNGDNSLTDGDRIQFDYLANNNYN